MKFQTAEHVGHMVTAAHKFTLCFLTDTDISESKASVIPHCKETKLDSLCYQLLRHNISHQRGVIAACVFFGVIKHGYQLLTVLEGLFLVCSGNKDSTSLLLCSQVKVQVSHLDTWKLTPWRRGVGGGVSAGVVVFHQSFNNNRVLNLCGFTQFNHYYQCCCCCWHYYCHYQL